MRDLLAHNNFSQVPQLSMGTLIDPDATTVFNVLSM
jgi:hypothetical protein